MTSSLVLPVGMGPKCKPRVRRMAVPLIEMSMMLYFTASNANQSVGGGNPLRHVDSCFVSAVMQGC